VIHRALSYAVRWGLVARNVADAAEPPRVPRRAIEPFSAEEIATLLGAIEGHRHQWLWTTMLATGIRFGEAAALRWSDVDLDARLINVRYTLGVKNRGPMFAEPKTTNARRLVPLPQIAVEALAMQRNQLECDRATARDRWQEFDLVFPSPSGRPLSQSHVLERFHRVLANAALPKRRMHDLRHTYATRLFALGQHPRAVQDLLGHSRFEITTNLYTATVPEVLRQAADRLDTVFRSTRATETTALQIAPSAHAASKPEDANAGALE
jgi:integrase